MERVVKREGEGRYVHDIPHAISDKIQRRDCGFLRVTRDITRDQAEETHEWTGARLREVVAGETAVVVVEGQADDEGHADDGEDEAGGGDEDAVAPAVAEVAAEEERDDFDGAAGGAVEEGLVRRVAEGGDELGEEVGDAAWRFVSVFA